MPPDTQVPTRTDRDSGDGAGKRQAAARRPPASRASTSKAQVALWTAAVVWALVDLLLLARAYPGGKLLTSAVTANWRPEYLVLLGLPVAAATMAKVTVANGTIAWADLQYVVFTLITLVYFTVQLLALPTDGLPAVPAAFLTLMGVSATAYTANKVASTKGVALTYPPGADPEAS